MTSVTSWHKRFYIVDDRALEDNSSDEDDDSYSSDGSDSAGEMEPVQVGVDNYVISFESLVYTQQLHRLVLAKVFPIMSWHFFAL